MPINELNKMGGSHKGGAYLLEFFIIQRQRNHGFYKSPNVLQNPAFLQVGELSRGQAEQAGVDFIVVMAKFGTAFERR